MDRYRSLKGEDKEENLCQIKEVVEHVEVSPFICGICFEKFQCIRQYLGHFKMHEQCGIGELLQSILIINKILLHCIDNDSFYSTDFMKDKEKPLSTLKEGMDSGNVCKFQCSSCKSNFPGICNMPEHFLVYDHKGKKNEHTAKEIDSEMNVPISVNSCQSVDNNNSNHDGKEILVPVSDRNKQNNVCQYKESQEEHTEGSIKECQDQDDWNKCDKSKTTGETITDNNVSDENVIYADTENDLVKEIGGSGVKLTYKRTAKASIKDNSEVDISDTTSSNQVQCRTKNTSIVSIDSNLEDGSNGSHMDEYSSSLEDIEHNKDEKVIHRKEVVDVKGRIKKDQRSCKTLMDEKIPCDVCGLLSLKKNIRRHILSHNSVKPYHCELCNKSFKTKDQLYGHKLHHKTVKDLICDCCGKAFNNGPNLRQHMKIHSGERTHKCPLCSKTFRNNYILKDHIQRHTDNKPYICEQCGKSFRTGNEVTRHLRVHSDDRPHPCWQCEKSFKSRSNLLKHAKTHK